MIYHYIQSFLRTVKKNRFFYAINLIGFLTGFLVLAIISTYVFQEISFDKFHKNANSIYRIHSGGYGVTPLCFGEKLKDQLPEISGIVRFSTGNLNLVQQGKHIGIDHIFYTDKDVFKVFSFKLLSGDVNTVLNNPFSMVISQSAAGKIFGEHFPVGESIRDVKGNIYQITGVMEDIPYNSHIQADAFISIETLHYIGEEDEFDCGNWSNLTYLSLSEKSDFRETENKLNVILHDSRMNNMPLKLQRLNRVYFDYDHNKFDGCRHGNLQTLLIYASISIFILFIVIINYLNLFAAISGARVKEIAIRKINGAMSSQIVKQIASESLLAVLISFSAALLIIEFLLPQLSNLLSINIQGSSHNWWLYAWYFAGIVIIGLTIGLLLGFSLSRVAEVNAFKKELFYSNRGFQRKILLLVQLTVVAVLLNSTFIIKNQIDFLSSKNLGINTENVVCVNLDSMLMNKPILLKGMLSGYPDIQSVSFSNSLIGDDFSKAPFGKEENSKLCCFYSIDADYCSLYGIKTTSGKDFSKDTNAGLAKCCLINETACRELGFTDPTGEIINGKEVIGVVADFNYSSLYNKIEPLIIQYSNTGNMLQIRISPENQKETISFIEKTCTQISPGFESNLLFLDVRMKDLYQAEFDLKRSFETYSLIALIISLLGLLGLTLFTVKKKIKEVGIRKLFGAKPVDTIRLLLREQIVIVIAANMLAIPVTMLLMNKWLDHFPFRIGTGFLIYLETLIIILIFTVLSVITIILRTHRHSLVETFKCE